MHSLPAELPLPCALADYAPHTHPLQRNRIERHLATCGQLKPQTSGGLTLIPTPTNSYGSPQPSLPGSDGGYAHAGTAAAAMRFAAAGAVMSGGGSMIGGTGDFADACSALREVGGAGGNYGALLPQHMGADGMGAMPLPDDQVRGQWPALGCLQHKCAMCHA